MRAIYFIGILAFFLIMVSSASAETIYLTKANEPEFDGKINIRVDYDGNAKTIAVKYLGDDTSYSPLGIDTFFYNLDSGTYEVVNVKEGSQDKTNDWKTNFGGTEASEFGNFLSYKNKGPASTAGINEYILFTLKNEFSSIPPNVNEHRVAVHIRFSDGKSTWVTDGNTNDIPEFPSIVLPVAAIMGIILISQNRRKKN